MRPEARYAAAIEVLDAWLDGMPAEKALTRWARGARYAGSKDRAAVRDHVYDVLRQKEACISLGGADTGRALILGLIRLAGGDPAEVFTGAGHAPTALSVEEKKSAPEINGLVANLPDWMRAELDGDRIDDVPALLSAMAERAPVWLRVNLRKTTAVEAIEVLAQDGVICDASPVLPTAFQMIDGARRLRNATAYLQGLVEVQDLSPQLAVARLQLPSRGRILDYCAGGGGKALAMAALTEATIFAHDALPQRMVDLSARAARAGVQIRQLSKDALLQKGPFDLVLADVPCSGSGTWRRDPEAKWRLTPEGLADLQQVQAEILDIASNLVAPNGRLVYMTCSLFRAENDEQIDGFLARHPEWHCEARHLDTPLTASDGFFSATLQRAPDSPAV